MDTQQQQPVHYAVVDKSKKYKRKNDEQEEVHTK